MGFSMDFGAALDVLKNGDSVRRTGWHGVGMRVAIVVPDEVDSGIFKALPYLRLYLPNGSCVPWTVSQTDVLADDWELAED